MIGSTQFEQVGDQTAECPEWAIKKLKSHNDPSTVGWEEFLIEGDCPECGCNRLVRANQTAGAVGCTYCPACDEMIQEP